MSAHPYPKQLAAYLHRLADKLDRDGGRALEMASLLASRGYPGSTNGNGSRSSDTTSSTERAALIGAPEDPAEGEQWQPHEWEGLDRRVTERVRLLWAMGVAVEADMTRSLAHGTTADQLPPGTGYCTCGGDDPAAPTWCGKFCAPRQNGASDRLRSGLHPACYKRFDRWRDTHPEGTVTDWKHDTRRAREIADERARLAGCTRAPLRG